MQSCNFGKENVLIFDLDPGGQVQNKNSKGDYNEFKDVIWSEVKLRHVRG